MTANKTYKPDGYYGRLRKAVWGEDWIKEEVGEEAKKYVLGLLQSVGRE